jgi:hypothetical protein
MQPVPLPAAAADKLKDKLDEDDKEKVEKAVQDGLEWLEENQVRASGTRQLCAAELWAVWGGKRRIERRTATAWCDPQEPTVGGRATSLPGPGAPLCITASSSTMLRQWQSSPCQARGAALTVAGKLIWGSFLCGCAQDAEKEDYEEKLKEVQDVCGPIISKVYAGATLAFAALGLVDVDI